MEKKSSWRVTAIANDELNRLGREMHSFRENLTSYFSFPFSKGAIKVRTKKNTSAYIMHAHRPHSHANGNPIRGYSPEL